MSDFDAPSREYTRPPMTRGVDPQRMNWLWQLILQATDLDPNEVRAALVASGVAVTGKRLHSWEVNDQDDAYFPLSIAELERNLRSVVAMKKQKAEAIDAAAEAASVGVVVDDDAAKSEPQE
ncbi:hypothetical protein [Luteibacter sp. dw_328]|uniref:hypothetical protein n=1 Tax=Luteibacter sp. dw_328 TaxID=2719796 RepID=UPI001BD30DEF|nr:hypothetical protein [Luteibacter sp. dw_328]